MRKDLPIDSDEKFLQELEKRSLDPNKNNYSYFGMKDCRDLKVVGGVAENNVWAGQEIEEEEFFVNKNDPVKRNKTLQEGFNWVENFGFHTTTRP